MKKKIALALVLALSLISVMTFAVSAEEACNHENQGYENVDEDGHVLVCYDCGLQLSDTELHVKGYGTHTDNYHEVICTVEGCYYTEQEAHSLDGYADDDYTTSTHSLQCSLCKNYVNEAHSFDGGVDGDGGLTYSCYSCNYQYFEHYHDYVYTPNGSMYHTVTCSKCDYSSQATHDIDFDNGTYTEGSDGSLPYWTYYCRDCGYEHVVQYNPSHTCDETKYNVKYVDGDLHEYVCAVCDKQFKTEAHAWNNGVVTQQPTPTENGVRTFTCTVCKGTKTETIDYIDLDKLLANMTQEEATTLYKKIFDKYQAVLLKDGECMKPYLAEFIETIFKDIAEKGAGSAYYAEYGDCYYAIMSIKPTNSSDYTRGYNDAIATIIDKNPVQGLFQGLWSSVLHFVVVIGNGIGIGGISLMTVLSTCLILVVVFFAVKVVRKD